MSRTTRLLLCTVGALLGFAANSLLCRAALGSAAIDPASFTSVRIVSGAAILFFLTLPRRRATEGVKAKRGNWISAAALVTYAISFSLAYVRLTTGTGALILFGVVQLTMIGAALLGGARLRVSQAAGLLLALSGLLVLCAPGVRAPDRSGALLMCVAGCGWGIYSLRGRGAGDPLQTTAQNFLRAVPFALLFNALLWNGVSITPRGLLLAIASGAIASGLGYSLWYAAVPELAATRAAVLQLAVPILAALGGVVFLAERPTLRLLIAAVLTLGGVALAIRQRDQKPDASIANELER